mmetsp:Transcript_34387/g.108331  ORF Transcript_34387/g.108331 Transcript_34387/m.108331 type:complete len:210 (-) Transcript_34387:226-855(-)
MAAFDDSQAQAAAAAAAELVPDAARAVEDHAALVRLAPRPGAPAQLLGPQLLDVELDGRDLAEQRLDAGRAGVSARLGGGGLAAALRRALPEALPQQDGLALEVPAVLQRAGVDGLQPRRRCAQLLLDLRGLPRQPPLPRHEPPLGAAHVLYHELQLEVPLPGARAALAAAAVHRRRLVHAPQLALLLEAPHAAAQRREPLLLGAHGGA